MQKRIGALTLSTMIALTGCGGGASSVDDNNNAQVESNRSLKGKVIDAEIKKATVFLDLDKDNELDSNEPNTKTKEDGSFELVLTKANREEENYKNQTAPLVAFGGTDIRSGKVFEDYLTSMINGKDEVNITPFTTLIAGSLEDNSTVFSKTSNKTTQEIADELKEKIVQIKKNLAELFGISEHLLEGNPIELAKEGDKSLINSSLQLHKSAQMMKKAMKGDAKKLKRSILKSYRALGKELRKLKKSALKNENEALLEVLDTAMNDETLFDGNLVKEVRTQTRTVIQSINTFWENQEGVFSDDTLSTAINEVETIVEENTQGSIENNTSNPIESGIEDSTENNTPNSTESGTEDSTENNTPNSTESGIEDSTENNTPNSTESGTEDTTENNTSNSTESGTEDTTENNTSNPTESGTEDTTENNTSNPIESATEDTTENNTSTDDSSREEECSSLTSIDNDSSFTDIFPSNNVEYSAQDESVQEIANAFNKAREADQTISKLLTMPSQERWGSMSIQEKALFLLNAERYDRGIKPFEGISPDVVGVAQKYAELLYSTGKFGHNEDGSPWERLDSVDAIKENKDFLGFAENLYVVGASNEFTKNPIVKAIYNWIYSDSGSSWGHRKFCLANNLNDNSGENVQEGLIGFGLKEGDKYAYYPNFKSTIIVMNAFDPSSSWNHDNTIQIACSDTFSTKNNTIISTDENSTNSIEENTTTSTDANSIDSTEENTTISTDENSTDSNDGDTTMTNSDYGYIPETIDNATAIRFLNKATFGATQQSIEALKSKGVEKWLDEQLAMPLNDNQYLIKTIEIAKKMNPSENSYSIDEYLADNGIVFNNNVGSFHSPRYRITSWFDVALRSPDQLRAKVTYALSQIIVESDFEPVFQRRAEALANYFDILQRHAFGSYEDLLNEISLSSGMGVFLTFNGSKKEYSNEANTTIYPDENYAREVMQLFSMGVMKLNLNGTPILDAKGNPIPTYTQEDVNQLARVFTGWDLKSNRRYGRVGFKDGDYTHPLELTASYHDSGEKKFLGSTIASGIGAENEIKKAMNIIMSQNSVAPYIAKNLIMRLTKSNPTTGYIQRVSSVFQSSNGDLKSVTKAILLDEELWTDMKNKTVVKFKEPVIAYTSFLRVFNAKPLPKWYYCGYGGPSDDRASNCQVIENSFLFNDLRETLNQSPALAPTVFNFYDNGFVPNSTAFKTSNSVAPEIQIQSDSVFINFSNTIRSDLFHWDKNYLLNASMPDYKSNGSAKRYNSIEAYIDDAPSRGYIPIYYVGANKMLLDVSAELEVMEKVIDGDTNGDFVNLKHFRVTDYTDDEKAVDTLVKYLNQKLTGGLLTQQQESSIADNLKDKIFNKYSVQNRDNGNIDESKYNKTRQLLDHVIFPAIRAVVTSNVYMTE